MDTQNLNALLGDNPLTRNLAELGIGTLDFFFSLWYT
jgi:hypothetical protein